MPAAIKYDQVHLYSRYASIESGAFRKYLTDNNIAFVELQYPLEQIEQALAPLNTWFEDGNGGRVQFSDFPILIFDIVYWEADDNSDRYAKRSYATVLNSLPSDFVSKVEKNS